MNFEIEHIPRFAIGDTVTLKNYFLHCFVCSARDSGIVICACKYRGRFLETVFDAKHIYVTRHDADKFKRVRALLLERI